MAKSVLDIVIRTVKDGSGMKQTVAALVDLKSGLTSAATAFAAIAGVAYTFEKALDATVGKAVEYANKVEMISNATGTSAEQSSRTIQVLDDLRVSYEDLSASVKKNADVTDFSVSGLAALSAEYQNLSTQTEKTAFAQEHFGKQWVEFIKVLEVGPERLRALGNAVDENLVFDDAAVKRLRDYQEAVDTLSDSWEGLTVNFGLEFSDNITGVVDATNRYLEKSKQLKEEGFLGNYFELSKLAIRENVTAWGSLLGIIDQELTASQKADAARLDGLASLYDMSDALRGAGDAASELNDQAKDLLEITFGLQGGYDEFAKKNDEVREKMAAVHDAFAEGKISAEEQTTQMNDLNEELRQNSAAMDRWAKQFVLSLVQARLATDGFTTEEVGFLISLSEEFGLVDEATATMAQNINKSLDSVEPGNLESYYKIAKDITALPHDQTFNIHTNYTSTGTPPSNPVTNSPLGPHPYAIGGSYPAGDPMLVHQDEVMVPSSGGYVLTRSDAQKILEDAANGGGSGGGGRNVTIYGGVTVIAQGGIMDAIEEIG